MYKEYVREGAYIKMYVAMLINVDIGKCGDHVTSTFLAGVHFVIAREERVSNKYSLYPQHDPLQIAY